MTFIEKTGRTVDDAIREALADLGTERDAVVVEILDEGSKGLFGLGSRPARVKVTLKAQESQVPLQPAAEQDQKRATTVEETGSAEDAIEAARTFLQGILMRLNLNVGIETREGDEGITHMNIAGEGVGLVIGRHGQTLDAIQYLTNVVANADGGTRVRIVVDAEGYRVRRAETLTQLAVRTAERVVSQRRKIVLEPMSALERRVVHVALQDVSGIETYSEGEDPHRRVVVAPAQS